MKKIILKSIIIISILVAVFIGFWGFYAYHFNGGLSSDQSRWAEFGDFFNGVISPIFAAINIYIFWYLTKVIEDKNEQRQKDIQDNEDRRQKERTEHEKALMLMQFRKAEIDRLDEALPIGLLTPHGNNPDYLNSLTHASGYLLSFEESKLDLFGLKENPFMANRIDCLKTCISQYRELMESPELDEEMVRSTMNSFLRLKFSIISRLQEITLNG